MMFRGFFVFPTDLIYHQKSVFVPMRVPTGSP